MEFTHKRHDAEPLTNMKRFSLKARRWGYWNDKLYKVVIYVLLFDLAFVFLFPFIYMIVTSIMDPMDLLDMTVKWIPSSVHLDNYVRAAKALDYRATFFNSLAVTIISTAGHILSCSLIAYGFARYKFPLKDILFAIVILTIIIPVQVVIFPLVIQYSNMGWLNTYLPLTVPTYFGFGLRGGLFIFIFHQFFIGLPYELEEAARIDGCGSFRTFWNIVLPVARTAVLVCVVLSMVWHWNDYFEPSIYLMKPNKFLLPARLPMMYESLETAQRLGEMADAEYVFSEAVVMAGTFLVILPILIMYLLLQRRFMEGIERSGLVG